MVGFRNALSDTTTVPVQAHWDPIANTANNLHWSTEEKFNRAKAQWHEPVDMEWEQWLALFNPKPAHPLKNYKTADFQVFLPPSTVNVGDVWDLDPKGSLPSCASFTQVQQRTSDMVRTERKRAYGHFRLNTLTLFSEFMRASYSAHPSVPTLDQHNLLDIWSSIATAER